MKIGVVNAGNIGLNLAVPWLRHGHEIFLSKDTNSEKLQERTREFGLAHGLTETELARFKYGSLADAAKFGDVILFSVYFPRLPHVIEELQKAGINFSDKTVIETINPVNVDANFNHAHDVEYMQRTSVTEELQKAFPRAIIFKSFNNTPSNLLDVGKWTAGRIPAIIFVDGNASSTATVRKLIENAGFRPQFAGHTLADARLLEKLGVLLHRLYENEYKGDAGIVVDILKA